MILAMGALAAGSLVDLANAYIGLLSSEQRAATVVAETEANASKWSNLPGPPDAHGANGLRNGVAFSTLNTAQQSAWVRLVQAALGPGYARFDQVRQADDLLGAQRNGYGHGYYYVGFVGAPSHSDRWLMQIGGHHAAYNLAFVGDRLHATTPIFLGLEPQTMTINGKSVGPLDELKQAMQKLAISLTPAQLESARLSGNFSDVGAGRRA